MSEANGWRGRFIAIAITAAISTAVTVATYNFRSITMNREVMIEQSKDLAAQQRDLNRLEKQMEMLTAEVRRLNEVLSEIKVLLAKISAGQERKGP